MVEASGGDRSRPAVRIWSATRPVGVGFLVSRRHVMTCAHVVADALGRRDALALATQGPEDEISLNFVRDETPKNQPTHRARVAIWHAEKEESSKRDIAVLELVDGMELPSAAVPIVGYPNSQVYDKLSGFGIKYGLPDGTYVNGQWMGYVRHDRVEISAQTTDEAVREGCSGAALWNLNRGGVAGMIVEMQTATQGRIIPIEILRSVFHGLVLSGDTPNLDVRSAAAPASPAAIGASIRKLLYSFDREQQESAFDLALEDSWGTSRSAIICSIAGLDADRPKLCRDRCMNVKLRAQLEALKIGGKLPVPTHVVWPARPLRKIEEERAKLASQVRAPLRAKGLTPEAIREAFNNGVAPYVFFSVIDRRWFDSLHRDLFLSWVQFWRDVGSQPLNKPLAVFLLLRLDGTSCPDLCLDQYFQDDLLPNPPVGAFVLERLRDFHRDEIDDWLRARADELGISEAYLFDRILPKLARDLPSGESLRLQQLEEWANKLCSN
jgi:hypothetical protein